MEACAIKPIETIYKGYRFRSRLEARWAVFFDACGNVEWEYEPEGFVLPGGLTYLPDFLIHNHAGRGGEKLWVEVKGKCMETSDADKLFRFAYGREKLRKNVQEDWLPKNPLLVVSRIPDADDLKWCNQSEYIGTTSNGEGIYTWSFELIDGDYYEVAPEVTPDGRLNLTGADSSYREYGFDKVIRCFNIARSARFEHGEVIYGH